MNTKKVAIVGGGPAGIFCAISVAELTDSIVTVFDYRKPLSTLLPTGGGRCNFSYFENNIKNFCEFYPRGNKFLLSVFNRFSPMQTVDYFEKIGIKSYVQDDNRIFPISNSSKNVADILLNLSDFSGINFKKVKVKAVMPKKNDGFLICTSENEQFEFDKVVLACGGKNFDIPKKMGHTIIPPKPSLCPLKIKESIFYDLQGVSLKNISSKIYFENSKIAELEGDLLFTDKSISGPLTFKISSVCARLDYSFDNPIKAHLKFINQTQNELLEFFENKTKTNPNAQIKNILAMVIVKSLAEKILEFIGIDASKPIVHISNKEKNKIISSLTDFEMNIIGHEKGGEIVTAGGVKLDEVNSKTLQSKIVEGLYFAGEILDIDGFTGGFNLQNCWSTARVIAMGLVEESKY